MDSKLLDACVVLLGPQARRAGQALLTQLTVAMVRSAFRRLALRTHPDAYGGDRDSERFIEASHAYELLMAFLMSRSATARPAQARAYHPRPSAARPAAEKPASDRTADPDCGSTRTRRPADLFYHGPLPRRRLRLAEFLYYSGRIPWQTLIAALVWQRASRPKFLEIARQLRFVESQDMTRVLQSRTGNEHTGETASRLQLLTMDDVMRILRIQRFRQRPIGRYFVEIAGFTETQLSDCLREMYRHNARCRLAAERQRSRAREKEEATA